MDRARRAGFTALIVVVVVAAAGGFAGPTVRAAPVVVAAVDTRRLRGADGRSLGLRRIRRSRQPGGRSGRPGRPRGRLCDGLGIDRDAEGDLDDVDDPRAGQARPDRERRGRVCRRGRCDLFGWVRGDRRGDRASHRRGCDGRCGRLGRRDSSFVEGTAAVAPPAGSSLERAPGGPAGNATDTNDNLSDWFVQGAPSPQGSGRACRAGPGADADTDAQPDPDPDSDPDADARHRPRRRPPTPTPRRRRPRRRRATPTPAPTATPTATPTADRDPDSDPGAATDRRSAGLADGSVVTDRRAS